MYYSQFYDPNNQISVLSETKKNLINKCHVKNEFFVFIDCLINAHKNHVKSVIVSIINLPKRGNKYVNKKKN